MIVPSTYHVGYPGDREMHKGPRQAMDALSAYTKRKKEGRKKRGGRKKDVS